MSSLTFDDLKKLTVNSQQANLYEKLINYEEKKLEEVFIQNLKDPDSPRILNIILNQLSSTSDGLKRKNHISKNILDAVIITHFNDLSNEQMNSLLSYLSLELGSLSTKHLLKLIDYSLNDLQDPHSTNIVWKQLIPTLLHIIKDEKEIEYDGTLMTGEEVKCRVITSICIIRWRENVMVPLADMFKSLDNILKPAEHSQIIGKFCSRFEDIQPENMPQLVNHLLSLCKNKNTLLLLFKLNLYYQNIRNAGEGGQPKTYDEISQASSNISEVTSSVNNVIHYIQAHLNLFGQSCWRQLLAGCRQLSGKPEALLDPFILTLVITFTQPNLKTQQESLELLKSTFLNHINELNCQKESQWLRRNTPKLPEISQALNYIIKFSFSQSYSFTEGLIETGFWFLSISGRGPQIEYLSTIGQTILTAFIISFGRTQRILTQLTQCIMFKKGDKRFTNCLNHLCLKVPQAINKNRELILQLLKHGASKMPNTCQEIILAIVPLVKRFTSFRENLIILLRSSLSTWDVNVRKMAVLGFLQLLKAHELSGFGALSQMSCIRNTASSLGSQPLTQGRAETREAICLELLVILQRCLNQQAQVRLIFYQGLYGSIHKNKELCPFLLTKLHNQINLALSDENAAIPFDMSACVENKETHVIIKEPLGHLIFASQQVVQMSNESELPSADLRQMNKLLGSLSERVAALTHNDLKINSPQDFQSNKVENAARLAQLALLSSVCEALLCYALSKPPKPNPAPGVALSLFKRYQEITDFLKSVGKKSDSDQKRKGRKRAAASEDDALAPSAKVRNTGRPPSEDEDDNSGDQDEVVMELIAEMPNKFKCPPTVLNLKACADLLNYCFSINGNCENGPLPRSREFQCYVLTSLNNLLLTEVSPRFELRTLLDPVSKCLFKVLDDYNNSPPQCSLALNCFESLWSLISKQCPDYFEKHLVITGGDPDSVLKRLEKLLEETLSTEEDTDTDKKYIISIISALSKLVLILPTTHETVHNAFAWLRKLIQRTNSTNTNAVRCIFTLLLTLDRRINSTNTLLDNMALTIQKVLGVYVEKQVEPYTHLDMISENAAPEILTCFLNNITLKLEDCRLLQVRLKAELVLPKPLEELDEILERSELELCKYLSHITKLLEYLTRARIPIGKLSTLLVKNIIILYQHIGVLCKYFILRCSPTRLCFQRARFENLIKLACYILKDTLLEFYIYIKKQSSKTKSTKTKNTKTSKTKSTPTHHDEKQLQRMVLVSELCEKAILALSKKTKVSLSGLIKVAGGREIRFENHKIGRLLAQQAATGSQTIESSMDGDDNEEEEDEENVDKEQQVEEEEKDEDEEEEEEDE